MPETVLAVDGLRVATISGAEIAEVLTVHGASNREAADTVRTLVERVGLPADPAFLRRYPFELSGGQQQRVAVAMALVSRPAAVVLDEPTTGLDVTTQAQVLDLLRSLGEETGAAFVYVTHDLAVVDTLAHRVAVMYAGRLVELGPRDRVPRRPGHPYTSLLLGSVPRLAVRRRLVGIAGTAPLPGHRPAGCFFEPRCPLAVERCREEFPPAFEVEPGHVARCWRAADVAAPVLRPSSTNGRRPATAAPLLDVRGVSASYGRKTVLHDVSFAIERGECRALAARPALLVCDEVTSALDVSIQAAIVALLDELRREGLAVLFITHNLALVNSIAGSVLVLQEGVVRERGPTADVIDRPADVYTRQLVAAVPDLGGDA